MNDTTENYKTKLYQSKSLILFTIAVIGILMMFVYLLSHKTQDSNKAIEKMKLSNPLIHADPESTLLEKVQKGIDDAKKQTDDLKKQFNDEIKKNGSLGDNKKQEIENRLAEIENKLSQKTDMLQNETNTNDQSKALPVPPGYQTSNPVMDDSFHEDRLSIRPYESMRRQVVKNPDTYVPAGTFAQAVMLSGADASAAVTSPHNPNPMIFRIISNGTLPNHKKSHLKDCVLTAYVVGDISSERGEINLDKLSCTFPNNEIIDPKVEGWIFGRDGKYGIRGRPVWREGKLLQRAFTAGALSGLSEGISQTYTTNSISPLGNTQSTNNGKILQVGAAKGTGKAMDKLADYNIQRAEQYHPVIQISPGDVVDVVFKDGFFLDGKKHDHDEENKNVPNMFESVDAPMMLPSDERTLPLSVEQVRRIKENSKQLGFRVTEDTNS